VAKLHFSLVSPERELFSGSVDQVDAPGAEGDFGVLADHAPFMTTLRQGRVLIRDGDVTSEGLTILAPRAIEASV
jgi:F-type H+-transporting ATPase subunit epsilon